MTCPYLTASNIQMVMESIKCVLAVFRPSCNGLNFIDCLSKGPVKLNSIDVSDILFMGVAVVECVSVLWEISS